jgi:shikimate dehydrogenase
MHEHKAIYGLIGYPVEHSLSPLMHNAAFKALGVNASYKLFPLKEEGLDKFFADLRLATNDIFGLNVTIPYKEKTLAYVDDLSPFAEKVKAVNTIVISPDRKLSGYNTDGPGFLTHLAEVDFDPTRKRVAIIGAGGASRAIISSFCLIEERPESILLYDIDQEKAENLITDLGQRMDVSFVKSVNSLDDLNIELADLLINATPIGMKKDDTTLIEGDLLHADMLVYDLIYNPSETALLKAAKQRGAKIANGLGMLFYQGVLAFQHWSEIELDARVKHIMWESLQKG